MRVYRSAKTQDVKSDRGKCGRFDKVQEQDIYRAIELGVRAQRSDLSIAEQLGICARTVFRHRQRLGLPSIYGRMPKAVS